MTIAAGPGMGMSESIGEATSSTARRPDLLTVAWRAKWRHTVFGIVLAIAALWLGMMLTPRFKAGAQLLVDPRDIKVLDNQLTPATDAQSIGITLVESQALVLGSDSVLGRVVDKLRLADDPEFNGRQVSLLRSTTTRLMQFSGRSGAAEENRFDTALDTLQRIVRVRRIDRTYVLEISATAQSKDKAKAIVETLLTAYLDEQAKSRSEVARRTGQDLDSGAASLRVNLEAAERRLASYKEQNDLVGVRGQFVNEQQLTDLNAQLINSRVEAARLEARRSGSNGGQRDLDVVPEALASATLRDLRVSLARVSQQKASLEAQMLPGHPAVKALADNERKIVAMINAEVGRIRESSNIELRRANANARALERQLAELREQLNRTNNAQIQLRDLEREVEVNRSLYLQALTRTREAQEQSRLNTANVRVISSASAEPNRAFPPPLAFLAGFGFFIGAMASMGVSVMREMARSARRA